MNLLALDTSDNISIIALQASEKQFSQSIKERKSHSETILPVIENLLKQAQIKLDDLDAIAFCRGPGSFTGLRMACSVVQALAYVKKLPVISLSSLDLIAQAVAPQISEDAVVIYRDARRDEFFYAYYQYINKGLRAVSEERVSSWKDINIRHGELPKYTTVVGADVLLQAASDAYERGELNDAQTAIPSYVRNAVTS